MSVTAAEAFSGAADSVVARVGGWLGVSLASDLDALELARRGLSPAQFRRVAGRFRLPADLPAPASTVRRREKKGERFTQAESERVLRVLRLLSEAHDFFDSPDHALAWMHRPARLIPGEPDISPLEMATSEIGARHVEELLLRSAYGMY